MRVLLIEDDSDTAQSIELMLNSEGFNVYTADLGEAGVDLGKLYDYDIILIDLNLPDMSGFEVLRSLRVSKVKTPILILSGAAGIEDKVKGLSQGADDYMTKPFHKNELFARIHAIVRRSRGHDQSVIQTGDLIVNLDAKTVHINRVPVHLTGKEYQMLELLSLRKGTTITKEMFLSQLYGGIDEPEIKIIDVFMCKIRKKLANASATGLRATVHAGCWTAYVASRIPESGNWSEACLHRLFVRAALSGLRIRHDPLPCNPSGVSLSDRRPCQTAGDSLFMSTQ